MDRDYMDVHLLADRYVLGKLSDSEQAAFEERLVWDQTLIDEVELAETLLQGLRATVPVERVAAEVPAATSSGPLRSVFSNPKLAAAASILLVGSLALNAITLTSPGPDVVEQGNTPQVFPDLSVRSDESLTITVDANRNVVFMVEPFGNYVAYRVSIHEDRPDAEALMSTAGLEPTAYGPLAVEMPGALLPPGEYRLRLEGRQSLATGSPYEPISDTPFRVRN